MKRTRYNGGSMKYYYDGFSIVGRWPRTAAVIALVFFLGTLARADNPADPMTQIKGGIGDVTAVFNDKGMPLQERRDKLAALADRYFDFSAMSRSVMGYHWRTLTPA